jgi:hypothetical protein
MVAGIFSPVSNGYNRVPTDPRHAPIPSIMVTGKDGIFVGVHVEGLHRAGITGDIITGIPPGLSNNWTDRLFDFHIHSRSLVVLGQM